jgi:DNA end-binding protein Ku
LIESKRSGQETVSAATKEVASNVTDLMAALQASIDRTKPNKPAATKKPAATRKKAAPRIKKQA